MEEALLRAIRKDPRDDVSRLAYADWLEERGDARAELVRTHLLLRALPPDHPHRREGEPLLSRLRRGVDAAWLAVIEPERVPSGRQGDGRICDCFGQISGRRRGIIPRGYALHGETQDTEGGAWGKLLKGIEDAALDGRDTFAPLVGQSYRPPGAEDLIQGVGLTSRELTQIVTLPPDIGRLKKVRTLLLYGSELTRIPPEIGDMEALAEFDPYTSYCLHWLPYEITRCPVLRQSRISTRALYGNYKHRPHFPRLGPYTPPKGLPYTEPSRECSVCRRPFTDRGLHRVWISLRVATDVMPLLVNACSEECVRSLPRPADGYVDRPHRGGLEVLQSPPL